MLSLSSASANDIIIYYIIYIYYTYNNLLTLVILYIYIYNKAIRLPLIYIIEYIYTHTHDRIPDTTATGVWHVILICVYEIKI